MEAEELQPDIQHSFEETLRDTNFQDIVIDVSGISIDSMIKDPVLQHIPVLGILINLLKFGANVRDKLFLKKMASFMYGLKDVPPADRAQMISKIDSSKE